MSQSLSDRACVLRDHLTDAYVYTRSQFGEESKTAKTVDALYASFFALREYLADAVVDSSECFYAHRTIPVRDLSETFCGGKRPMRFTEEQRTHLIATCHQLSVFLEDAQKTLKNKEESARIFRRTNRRIRAVRKLVKLNTARILF
jgi:heterodisulfide reductase subunit B